MKFKVIAFDIRKDKNGKDWKSLKLKDKEGNMYNRVPFWASYPNYEEVGLNTYLEGTIETTQNGEYENHKLNLTAVNDTPVTPKTAPQRGFGGSKVLMAEKAQMIEKSQERKQEFIEEAQGNKNEAIKMAGAQRDAVLIVINFLKLDRDLSNISDDSVIKREIEKWYNYFMKLHEKDTEELNDGMNEAFQRSMQKDDDVEQPF